MANNEESGEKKLMLAVKAVAGPYLAEFAPTSSVPEAFWAALTANESGADIEEGTPIERIRRREPSVFTHLAMVAAGFTPRYGSITEIDFAQSEDRQLARPVACHAAIAQQAPSLIASNAPNLQKPSTTVADLLGWASSWGWTQLMGYHSLVWKVPLQELVDSSRHYHFAAKLMAGFTGQYDLDPTKDFEQMARCWNTGRPNGVTYDLQYVANLLRRMEVWKQL